MKPKTLSLLIASATLAACGGGGDQVAGIDGGGSPAPVATTIVPIGTITGFGSVIVNDVRYDTSGTTILIDGVPGTEADLAVGQVVVLRGTLDTGGTTGVAESIDFDDIVEGPISAIDSVAGTLTVLGQLVQTDLATSFDDSIPTSSLLGLSVGDAVEVSGFILADGSIRATRISLEQSGGDVDVLGIVSNLTATTFQINDLVVDYSGAMLEDFPNGSIENGQRVEATGNSFDASGALIATIVEFEDSDFDDDIDQVKIEGFITRFVSPTDFDVEGIAVTTTAQTVYENGDSSALALNAKVEVEGAFNASGTLVATKVEIEPVEGVEIQAGVEAIQAGALTMLGLTVTVDSSTRLEDKSAAQLEPFAFSDLSVGDYLEIRGFEDGNGGIVATLLERLEPESDVELQGPVDTVNDPDFSILGVTVVTNANTDFEDRNELPISATDFFNQALGVTVKAEGTLLNGTIVADEVELED